MIKFSISLLILLLPVFGTQDDEDMVIFLVGDSTMAVKDVDAYPETGWGMPFVYFWDSTVKVENHAKNGRSSSSFFNEGRWDPILENLQSGDYVLIQFGHNDESKSKGERYSSPEKFKENLIRYVSETRDKNARPILITPVSRRQFDDKGKVMETHHGYSDIVRNVAEENDVTLIDLDKLSMELYQKFGKENSKLLFLHLKPGEHPNYPNGKEDNTHFNEFGARLIAQLVLKEIRELDPELAGHIVEGRR